MDIHIFNMNVLEYGRAIFLRGAIVDKDGDKE